MSGAARQVAVGAARKGGPYRDRQTQLTSTEKKELTELRKDKRRLELEVEILQWAAAYFARENIRPN